MIDRDPETPPARSNIWARLAEPLPDGVISWRQDGKPAQREGRYFARFVCYIEANTVRERLDAVVPGEWDLTLELLPPLPGEATSLETACSFKARLAVLGVIREDVGHGKDYKQASTDAFKRAAVRFGIGHELYAYEQNWVQVDGDGRYAKPLEDPQVAYTRRYGGAAPTGGGAANGASANGAARAAAGSNGTAGHAGVKTEGEPKGPPGGTASPTLPADAPAPLCPKCRGRMWDNRTTKRSPKAPDFKCRDRACDGVIWPPKDAPGRGATPAEARRQVAEAGEDPADYDEMDGGAGPLGGGMDDIPF